MFLCSMKLLNERLNYEFVEGREHECCALDVYDFKRNKMYMKQYMQTRCRSFSFSL